MTDRCASLVIGSPQLLIGRRRANMATTIVVQTQADPATHLTHLIEPTHRITHVGPLPDVDGHSRAAAEESTWHGDGCPHVDQEAFRSSQNGTVAA